jgi:hypothetical protein
MNSAMSAARTSRAPRSTNSNHVEVLAAREEPAGADVGRSSEGPFLPRQLTWVGRFPKRGEPGMPVNTKTASNGLKGG